MVKSSSYQLGLCPALHPGSQRNAATFRRNGILDLLRQLHSQMLCFDGHLLVNGLRRRYHVFRSEKPFVSLRQSQDIVDERTKRLAFEFEPAAVNLRVHW